MHWFKWNIQIMWYPEPYLDSIITKCDFIQEGLFRTFWISKIWLQLCVPDNRFNVCEEITFSRTFRKNNTERNKQDLNSQLIDTFITNQCYSFRIKDQGIVQMKLMQLLQHRSKSPEVDIKQKSEWKQSWQKEEDRSEWKQSWQKEEDRRYLKMKTPGCCAFQQQFLGPPSSSPLFCC